MFTVILTGAYEPDRPTERKLDHVLPSVSSNKRKNKSSHLDGHLIAFFPTGRSQLQTFFVLNGQLLAIRKRAKTGPADVDRAQERDEVKDLLVGRLEIEDIVTSLRNSFSNFPFSFFICK